MQITTSAVKWWLTSMMVVVLAVHVVVAHSNLVVKNHL
jgi:hypothetical protein